MRLLFSRLRAIGVGFFYGVITRREVAKDFDRRMLKKPARVGTWPRRVMTKFFHAPTASNPTMPIVPMVKSQTIAVQAIDRG